MGILGINSFFPACGPVASGRINEMRHQVVHDISTTITMAILGVKISQLHDQSSLLEAELVRRHS